MPKKRQTIQSLIAMKISKIKVDREFFYFYDQKGKLALQTSSVDTFDADGMYFSETIGD